MTFKKNLGVSNRFTKKGYGMIFKTSYVLFRKWYTNHNTYCIIGNHSQNPNLKLRIDRICSMYSHAVYFFFKGVELPKNIQIRTFLHDVKKSKYILVLMYEKFFKNLLFFEEFNSGKLPKLSNSLSPSHS